MTPATSPPIPDRVAKGLRIFWVAWAASVALGLFLELRPIFEHLYSLNADRPYKAGGITGMLLVAPLLMLTPKFVGSSVAAVMLLFVARRKGWSRWVLLVGMIASGLSLVLSVRVMWVQGASSTHIWILALRGLLYLAMVMAVAQFFSTEASAWFKPNAALRKTPQNDVA